MKSRMPLPALSNRMPALVATMVLIALVATAIAAAPAASARADSSAVDQQATDATTSTITGTVRRWETPGHIVGSSFEAMHYVLLRPYSSGTTTSYSAAVDESGHFSIEGVSPGAYLLMVGAPTNSWYMSSGSDGRYYGGDSWNSSDALYIEPGTTIDSDFFVPFERNPLFIQRERIAGADRYETAARVSQYGFIEPTSLAFLASGENFPDALSAAPAAARFNAPLLLTAPGALPAATIEELRRLQTQRVIVVGGEAVISPSVVDGLSLLGVTVERLAGDDRYATSIAVARYAFPQCQEASIATGNNFPDALALSARGGPLLLTDGTAQQLRGDTRRTLADLGCDSASIGGGTAVVSSGIFNELDAALQYGAQRFAGWDRYETARIIADHGDVQRPHVFIAAGSNYPDALAAASYAARIGAPVYLATRTCVPSTVVAQIRSRSAALLTVVGGLEHARGRNGIPEHVLLKRGAGGGVIAAMRNDPKHRAKQVPEERCSCA